MLIRESRILLCVGDDMKGSTGKVLAGIVAATIAILVVIIFFVGWGNIIPSENNDCMSGNVYLDKISCDCPETSEWVEEAGGWLCIQTDPNRNECGAGQYSSVDDCECKPPKIWIMNEGVPTTWVCEVW